jgi:Rrf2 family transcriptional repressor of oqxAB
MIDTRFSTALQIVMRIAVNEQQQIRSTSQSLAAVLSTNASFVRKLVSPLTASGILRPTAGINGGIKLGRPASAITLCEIFKAVSQDKPIWALRQNFPGQCPVTINIGQFSRQLCDTAEQAVLDTLAKKTLEASLQELLAHGTVAPES